MLELLALLGRVKLFQLQIFEAIDIVLSGDLLDAVRELVKGVLLLQVVLLAGGLALNLDDALEVADDLLIAEVA
jgi:hypothetical protein